ncbi:autophagy protein 5 [Saccharata proteae CBS 121410]|uniref:Autophagy protein 5 n=1 Tax=Saccharata proteae CBS 121410 TaxID=1314787 RepID=A0A9P4HZU9_9PEZI|nr:autophagy protein 5 [Saccharata proteae CBS 121410]
MSVPSRDLAGLQQTVWQGSIPLEIRLASSECRTYDNSDPYLIQAPRLSYLPFLLPRLHAFFESSLIDPNIHPSRGWFSFEEIPLKWHHPLGLLYDLYSGVSPAFFPSDEPTPTPPIPPWRLVLHFTDWPPQLVPLDPEYKALHDSFVNTVKEADFLRNGTAKAVMSLSKESSTQLWRAVEAQDLEMFNPIYQRLVSPQGGAGLRHLPMKVYLPSTPDVAAPGEEGEAIQEGSTPGLQVGSMRTVVALVTPMYSSRQPQTLGTALNAMLPTVFQSRRTPLLAVPVLHGAVVPLSAVVEDLVKAAAYADGFLHVVVSMLGE